MQFVQNHRLRLAPSKLAKRHNKSQKKLTVVWEIIAHCSQVTVKAFSQKRAFLEKIPPAVHSDLPRSEEE